jgi:hypothetical protein
LTYFVNRITFANASVASGPASALKTSRARAILPGWFFMRYRGIGDRTKPRDFPPSHSVLLLGSFHDFQIWPARVIQLTFVLAGFCETGRALARSVAGGVYCRRNLGRRVRMFDQSPLEEVAMPNRKQMMGALDDAFAEQMKTLFVVLAGSTDVDKAAPRFAKGLAQACDAYDKAAEAIKAQAS